jgi:hypothetical protein
MHEQIGRIEIWMRRGVSMAQKSSQVSAKKKAMPPKVSAKVAGKKPKSILDKAKSVIAKATTVLASPPPAPTPVPAKVRVAKPVSKFNAPLKKAPLKAAPPALEKAKSALKKEQKVADAAPVKEKKSRKISIEASANEAASALSAKWNSLFRKADQIDAKPYNMRGMFEEKTAITHKVLGWGYILANRNDRLEVLFKDGIKYLISNYKT